MSDEKREAIKELIAVFRNAKSNTSINISGKRREIVLAALNHHLDHLERAEAKANACRMPDDCEYPNCGCPIMW